MKKIGLIAIMSFVWLTSIASQNVTEVIINEEDSYYPLFSDESGRISINFIKSYAIGDIDTSYNLMISVVSSKVVLDGFSIGFAFLNSNYLSSGGTSFKINRGVDQSIFTYDQFSELYDCINTIFTFISNNPELSKDSEQIIASCQVNNLSVGVDYDPKDKSDKKVIYYFQIGESATYKMSKLQFISLIKDLKKIKANWEERK